MRYFTFLFFFCLFFSKSMAGKMPGDLAIDASTDSSEASSARRQPPSFSVFCDSLQRASLQCDTKAFPELLETFKSIELEESRWEVLGHKQKALKWSSQKSWKSAVGAKFFLDAALDEPHQNLLRNGLTPLLSWSPTDQQPIFLDTKYIEVITTINTIFDTHPYMHRTVALYNLAAATCLGDPLAHLFLMAGLRVYEPNNEKFYYRRYSLIGVALFEEKTTLSHFVETPEIQEFTDVETEDLQDVEILTKKAQLGLPFYYVFLGDISYETSRANPIYSPELMGKALQFYSLAAQKKDPIGLSKAANTIEAILVKQNYTPLPDRTPQVLKDILKAQDKSLSYEDAHEIVRKYELLAGRLGEKTSLSRPYVKDHLTRAGTPASYKAIFRFVKRLLKG